MDALIEKHPNKVAAVIGLMVLGFAYWRLMPANKVASLEPSAKSP